ncbi:MAG: glycosyltransferase family 4 protein [Anaerolineae bacterium]
MGIRLGFHYHGPARQDSNGLIHVSSIVGVFIDSLAELCDEIICFLHSPLASEEFILDHTIRHSNVKLVDIGPHTSIPRRLLNVRQATNAIKQWRGQLDILLLRGPSPLLPAMAKAAGDTPIALLLVGDYLAEARNTFRPNPRRIAQWLLLQSNRIGQERVIRKHLTFVNSRQLYDDLKDVAIHIIEIRTTTLTATDMFDRDDTCQQVPYHVLYTGRITSSKGVPDILDAVLQLREQGIDIVLDLVGWAETGDDILQNLADTAAAHHASQALVYHGLKTVGEDLFAYYKQADVYVIASRSSFEGFPRTIWEALAHSVPVLATPVGSIPLFLQDEENVLLFEPNNPTALAKQLKRLLDDSALRRKLIAQGRDAVRGNTLENRAQELVNHLEQWCSMRAQP